MAARDTLALAAKMSDELDLSDLDEIERFNKTGFNQVGDTYIGVRPVPAYLVREIASHALELGPKGIKRQVYEESRLCITYGGTPHHVRHQFGYWHINDVDEVQIWAYGKEEDDPVNLILLMRVPRPGERDMFAWYCEQCWNLLHCEVYDSGRLAEGWDGFMRAERAAIETFNRDVALRTCRECGSEHPLAYGFWSPHTTPEEERARPLW